MTYGIVALLPFLAVRGEAGIDFCFPFFFITSPKEETEGTACNHERRLPQHLILIGGVHST